MSTVCKPHLFFAVGQVILGLCLAVCLYLIPGYLLSSDQGGVSNYGTEPKTQWLYTAGFAAAAISTFLAGIKLVRGGKRGTLRVLLVVLSLLYALVLVTTFGYKLSTSLAHLHGQAAFVLFVGMLGTAVWSFVSVRDNRNKFTFVALCTGITLGILAATDVLRVLFIAEIFTGLAFAFLLTHTIGVLERR